jgi:hypothetical protein
MDKNLNSFSKNTNSNEIFSYLFEKTCSSNINLIYYIDYLTYKKKLIKNITNDIELIMNFFSDDVNDIVIKINILKKKNKINDNEYKIFESIYELINAIKIIDFFDQDDFLNISLILFKIKLSIDKIIIFFDSFKFRDLIDIKFFIDRFNELFNNISKNNIFLKTLIIILLTPDENIALCEIKNLAKQISIDFFMCYDSEDLYDKILVSIDKINKINLITNLKNDKINKIDKIDKNDKKKLAEVYFKLLKNNKNVFVNEYNYYINKHLEIYSNYEFELKIKFKLKKKPNIIKLIENLTYISDIN